MARRFHRCPLEYLLFYRYAAGGSDPGAVREKRLIHRLKTLVNAEDYPAMLAAATIRKFFYDLSLDEEPEYADPETAAEEEAFLERRYGGKLSPGRRFAKIFRTGYFFCKRDILTGEAWEDHGKVLFRELYYRECDITVFFPELEEELQKTLDALLEARVPETLDSVPPHDRIRFDHPLALEHLGKLLRAAPVAAWRKGPDTVYFMPGEISDAVATVCLVHASLVLLRRPDRVELLWFSGGGLRHRGAGEIDITNAMARIDSDIDQMAQAHGLLPENPEKCEKHCIFREFCDFF